MDSARNISKTALPDLSRTIARPRLIRQISDAGNARVILITGQAAQGKSILAAEMIRRHGHVAAWMQLDSADSDPVNFLHLLAHALKAAYPSLDISGFMKHPAIALGSTSVSDRIAEQVEELLSTIIVREPVRLVIDGLEALPTEAASLTLIDRIIDIVSPPSCLILVSRATPLLNLESLRVRQELVALNNSDLAFTTDEIFQFYAALYGLELAAPELMRIRELTDGWVGGLVLIREVLRQVPDAHRAAYIKNGLPAALQGEYLSYFSETVFAGLDENVRRFLIKTAIFDIIQPTVLTHYFEDRTVADIEAILARLVRQNLFIHRLYDPVNGWGYRYNQLFRDFLKEKFKHRLSDAEQQRLVTGAADLAWGAGDYEGAIRFFLEAGKYDKASAGIKKIAMGLCAQGRFADLTGWIAVLPRSMIQDDAWLSFYVAMGRRIKGGRRNISTFSAARERFESENDRRGQLLSLAYLIEAAVFVGHPTTVLKDWLEVARTMIAKASRSQYHAFAKAVLWTQMAFGYLAGTGDLQRGLSACRSALLLANTVDDDTLIVNATIIHAFGLTLSGEFNRAEKALTGIEHLATATYPEYRTLTNIVRLELALSGGDLERTQHLIDEIRKDIDAFGLLFLYPLHVDLTGQFQIHKGRFNALGRTANHLEDVATLAANPFYQGLAMRLRALKAYHQGRFQRAERWARQAVEVVENSLGESIHLARCRMILGMVAYHQHDLSTARQELDYAREFFSRVSSHLSLAESLLGLSLVERQSADGAAADQHLESALARVASQGYEAFPIISTRDILSACLPARQHGRLEIARIAAASSTE
jgi:LuxR family maltose regulon positive regulatory protein